MRRGRARTLRRRYGRAAGYWDAPGRIASLEKRATGEWSRIAGEPVTVEVIGGVLYAFGSELALRRLHAKMRHGSVGFSENMQRWYYTTDKHLVGA